MSDKKYVVGIDFGTESGRALLVEVETGAEVATLVRPYPNGVIDEKLPRSGIELPPDWALQDPADYLEVLKQIVPGVLQESGVDPADVIGLGVDFTCSTLMPVKADGTPLRFLPEWRDNPHAWVKLWKHHAAQPEANKLTELAYEMGYDFLDRYGGKASSEWYFPKLWQILDEAPDVYQAMDRLVEAGVWIVWQLTGQEKHSACMAGYKAFWSKQEGFPPDEYFKAADPRLEQVVEEKLTHTLHPLGARAGELTPEAARWTGLQPGTAVAVANIDAHVCVPAATVTEPGRMAIIMGTSNCHMVLGTEAVVVPGICGSVEDGMVPGFFGHEAGQSCAGDHFAWFVQHCVPEAYAQEAQKRGLDLHQLLEEKAARLRVGESGLVALDWWNGNRSVLVDVDLTGLLVGATLATRPEEIYRALIEATAYGTRIIIETFEEHEVPVDEIIAIGGLPDRNKLLMQIYADVTGRPIHLAASSQGAALGSAMHGAVAAGPEGGGYESILEAARYMTGLRPEAYEPLPENKAVYDKLYDEYLALHDYFGRGQNDVMKRLKRLKAEVRAGNS